MKTAILFCIFPLFYSCGDSRNDSPAPPKVVSQKIVIENPKETTSKTAEKKMETTASAATATPTISAAGTTMKDPVKPEQKVQQVQSAPAMVPSRDIAEKLPANSVPAKADANVDAESAVKEKSLESDTIPEFAYISEGKTDPFLPLFQEKVAAKEEPAAENDGVGAGVVVEKKKERRIPRTPLEKMDLSQLKLVAIIRADSGNRALVQDATGKGYVLNTGTYVGLNSGIVKQIEKDKVIVEEEVEDVYGKSSLREREMVLQKPLGEI